MLSKPGFEMIARQVKHLARSGRLVHEHQQAELNAASAQKQA